VAGALNEADLQLIRAAQGGDRAAYGRLVERFKGRIYAMALAITGKQDEAQDLTQETFVRALEGLPNLSAPEKFPSWVRGITSTVSKDVRRKVAREKKHVQASAWGKAQMAAPTDQGLAEREANMHEQTLVADQVAALPENTRIALDLRFREDLSYAQIGQIMGVPVSTVRGLLFRGTQALRQKLKPILKRTRGAGK
jgi:RNA polymerase sigma-70 factor, ECF subfamily